MVLLSLEKLLGIPSHNESKFHSKIIAVVHGNPNNDYSCMKEQNHYFADKDLADTSEKKL